ncbi:flavin-containing monooxygenase FMO GS-OX5-like isoform X2 [Homarus americanus]|nr:flavin-containing monooxygenase FMO GS-OX5-like isoform X2 [Homarus americanus]XP_042209898.1 flavin-containing monooxygenase FMO GS-OX5-like isoform X2 [Homarus americanus]
MKLVGVIGAGAAGLCAARHILATRGMSPVVWEKSLQSGGTWVYTPQRGKDEFDLPIHSSIYENLKTNLPKEVMGFPDFPFPSGEESFLHHSQVLQYLDSYAEHYNLHPHIKYGHFVEEVKPVKQDESYTAWDITVRDLESKKVFTTTCDALLVCNGHYSLPQMPEIKDIDKFHGPKSHSHDYREPSPYKDSKVVVLGASASGLDIALELATVAKEVLISHNHPVPIPSELPPNVRQVRGVVSATENGFVFGDGSSAEADMILYCTGYHFTFPFLTEDCGITVEDRIVKPLYKHLFNTKYPSMAFIGIPFQVCPFPLFDIQVQYVMAVLKGVVSLPPREKMDDAFVSHLHKQRRIGYADKSYHQLTPHGQINYTNELSAQIGIVPPLKSSFGSVNLFTALRLVFSFTLFRKYQYRIESDGSVMVRLDGRKVNTVLSIGWLVVKHTSRLLLHDFFGVIKLTTSFLSKKLKSLFFN